MSVEENKALVRRYYSDFTSEANTEAAAHVADQILASNFAFYALNNVQGSHGLDRHKQFLVWHHGVTPDEYWTVEELVAEGNTVASRFMLRGTQQGEFMGVAPTGKLFTVRGMDFFRITGGQIAELRRFFDLKDLLEQLSAAPIPEQAPSQ